jgi:hypothetical protein
MKDRKVRFLSLPSVAVEDDSVSARPSSSSSSSSSASANPVSSSTTTVTRLTNGPLVIYSDTCCQGKGWFADSGFHRDDILFLLDSHHFLDRFYKGFNKENITYHGAACSDMSKTIAQVSPGRLPEPKDIRESIEKLKSKYSALVPPVWTEET